MTEETKEPKKEHGKDDNVVFIGSKPFMNYVRAVEVQFSREGCNEVVVKARGKFISRCVDVVEVASKRFLENQIAVKGIKVDSEDFENKEGKEVRVSTIEITLEKI